MGDDTVGGGLDQVGANEGPLTEKKSDVRQLRSSPTVTERRSRLLIINKIDKRKFGRSTPSHSLRAQVSRAYCTLFEAYSWGLKRDLGALDFVNPANLRARKWYNDDFKAVREQLRSSCELGKIVAFRVGQREPIPKHAWTSPGLWELERLGDNVLIEWKDILELWPAELTQSAAPEPAEKFEGLVDSLESPASLPRSATEQPSSSKRRSDTERKERRMSGIKLLVRHGLRPCRANHNVSQREFCWKVEQVSDGTDCPLNGQWKPPRGLSTVNLGTLIDQLREVDSEYFDPVFAWQLASPGPTEADVQIFLKKKMISAAVPLTNSPKSGSLTRQNPVKDQIDRS